MNDTKDSIPASEGESKPGPFLAKVVSHLDSSYMGGLEVEILRNVGNDSSSGQTHQVKYMSPFYGVTNVDFTAEKPDDYNNTQKSYGMWMIPPDPGTTVVVIFIDGDPKRGYWIGCVQDANMNFMVPGLAATESVVEGGGRLPVAEYNKTVNKGNTASDSTSIKKPQHPYATAVLQRNGLIKDDIRGITTSSARRETPSMVFGISTPGPLDKSSSAKKGTIGKKDHPIKNAYVSRLGGSSFVMDDGDDKFVREQPASAAAPKYAAVEQGATPGESDHAIPHNELIRIRTRSGHQILLHNSEDLIYISHGSGNSWIEMTANGKIDVYAANSINVYSGNDINFTAQRDINFHAKTGNINVNAALDFKCTAQQNFQLIANQNGNISVNQSLNLKSNHHVESSGKIDMNGPAAAPAKPALFPGRVPQHEPWLGHENLNPLKDYPASASAIPIGPTGEPSYTTSTDTFAKIKAPEDQSAPPR